MGKKEIMKKDSTADLVGYGDNEDSWGAGDSIDENDILVPKILVMQKMSKLMDKDPTLKFGDFVDSVSEEVVSNHAEGVEFVVFGHFKTLLTFHGKEFEKSEPFVPSMHQLPFRETVNGIEITRSQALNFYVLLVKDIKDGEPFPYVLQFKKTSAKRGKKLSTEIRKLAAFNKPSAARVFKLTATEEENEHGKFLVFDISKVRPSTPDEVKLAKFWYDAFKAKNVQVHETEDEEKPTTSNPDKSIPPSYAHTPPTINEHEVSPDIPF